MRVVRLVPMNDRDTPDIEPAARRGKWITLALLAALAAFMYAGIVIKVMKYGF
jgi:hypothetical protein